MKVYLVWCYGSYEELALEGIFASKWDAFLCCRAKKIQLEEDVRNGETWRKYIGYNVEERSVIPNSKK